MPLVTRFLNPEKREKERKKLERKRERIKRQEAESLTRVYGKKKNEKKKGRAAHVSRVWWSTDSNCFSVREMVTAWMWRWRGDVESRL